MIGHGAFDMSFEISELTFDPIKNLIGSPAVFHSEHILFDQQKSQGYVDLLKCRQNLVLLTSQMTCFKDNFLSHRGEGFMSFQVMLDGVANLSLENGNKIQTRKPCAFYEFQPEGINKREVMHNGDYFRYVILYFKPSFLVEELGLEFDELPNVIRSALNGHESYGQLLEIPLTKELITLTKPVINMNYAMGLERLSGEIKALEILLAFLNLMKNQKAQQRGIRLTPKEEKCLQDIRAILDSSFTDPPSLTDFADLFDVPEKRIIKGFKTLFGHTISDYTHLLRMQKAKHMLKESTFNITQIALECGYNHPGNFSTAFKRFFGKSPLSYQGQSSDQKISGLR